MISEKVDNILTGNEYPFKLIQIIKDIFRGIGIAIRNLVLEIIIMLFGSILNLIPIIGWLSRILLLLVPSYFYGFSFMDYTNERKKRDIKESVSLMRKYKWVAITNGGVFAISLLIPFLSLFVAILTVIAGTVAMDEIEKREEKKQ